MAVTLSDTLLQEKLQFLLDRWNADPHKLQLGLYTSSTLVPSDDSATSDFTSVEADFPGYARQTIDPWTGPTEDEGAELFYILSSLCRFCRSDTGTCQTVYGVFAIDPDDGEWRFAEQTWPAGIDFCNVCDCVSVQAKITDQDVTPGPH